MENLSLTCPIYMLAPPGTRNYGERNRRDGNACNASWVMTRQFNRNCVDHVAVEKYREKKRNRLPIIEFSKYNKFVA